MSNPIFQGISLFDSVGLGLLVDSAQNLFVDVSKWNNTALGSPTAFGTAPSGNVIGANSSLFAGSTALTATGSSLNVNITGGSSSGQQYADGASSGGTFPTGTASLGYDGTDVWVLRLDGSKNLKVNLQTALPAGTNVIGHVITDSGSTTVVTGTVAVTQSGTWTVATNADATPGSAIPAKGFIVGGSDGTNFRDLNVSTSGTALMQDAVDASAANINFFATNSGAAGTSVNSGSYVPVISIRANSASKIFRLRGIDVMALNGAASAFQLIRNATLTGASFATVTGTNMQSDTAATSLSGGTVVDAGFVAEQKARDKNIAIYIAAGAPGDILTLAFNPSSGSSLVAGAFQWSEQAAAL